MKLAAGIKEIVASKGISEEIIIDAVKDVLAAAYKEYFGATTIDIEMDLEKNILNVFIPKQIAKRVRDPRTQINHKQAAAILGVKEVSPDIETVMVPYYPVKDFSPVEIMKISNSIIDKIRDFEKNTLRHEFFKKRGELASGTVIKINEKGDIFIDLGKTIGMVPFSEQSPLEHYEIGDNIRAVVIRVDNTYENPKTGKKISKMQITLSRKSPRLIKELLFIDIPEVVDETTEIKGIARIAGYKTKVLVSAGAHSNVDPVGSCIGPHGVRIIPIIKEIGGEKIDIIRYSDDIKELVSNALTPAKVNRVIISKDENDEPIIYAVVPPDQLPYAFGKQKQNVILVSKLCNYRIQIKTDTEIFEDNIVADDVKELNDIFGTNLSVLPELTETIVNKLQNLDIVSVEQLAEIHIHDQYSQIDTLNEEELALLKKVVLENIEIEDSENRFEDSEKEPQESTPLEALSDLKPEWIALFKESGVNSIEELIEEYNDGFSSMESLSEGDKEEISTIIVENIEIED